MSYENAPSTILLATHCAACNRPLRDAQSVEAGMGPDCREKYGYAGAQTEPDWDKVNHIAEKFDLDALDMVARFHGDAHKVANMLVHRAACAPREERALYIECIAALGFTKLAAKLAEGAGEVVEVKRDGEVFVVVTPYNPAFVGGLKDARIGARWNPARKAWTVPTDDRARAGLWRVVKAHYAGAMLASEKGLTRIAA